MTDDTHLELEKCPNCGHPVKLTDDGDDFVDSQYLTCTNKDCKWNNYHED